MKVFYGNPPEKEEWVCCSDAFSKKHGRCRNKSIMTMPEWLNRPIESELRNRIRVLTNTLIAAKDALLSYKYGNVSPELATEVVEYVQKILQNERE